MSSKLREKLANRPESQSPNPSENPKPEPEASNRAASPVSSAESDLVTSHLDELAAEIEREEKAERSEAAYAEREAVKTIEAAGKDAFFDLFQMAFAMPNVVPIPPFPLESLPIQPHEMQMARKASDAVYDIAAKSEYLRWIIEPSGPWLAILPFVTVKAMAVRAELAARKPEPVAGTIPEPSAQVSPAPATGEPKTDASTVIELAA